VSYEAALVTLLNTATPDAVYRGELPENAPLPAQSYTRVDTVKGYAHDGDDRLPTVRVQVDCWANDADAADTVADAGPRALSGYSDDFFQRIEIADDRELDEPDNGIFRRMVDLLITYSEVTP
jgi:hypothetical protein